MDTVLLAMKNTVAVYCDSSPAARGRTGNEPPLSVFTPGLHITMHALQQVRYCGHNRRRNGWCIDSNADVGRYDNGTRICPRLFDPSIANDFGHWRAFSDDS